MFESRTRLIVFSVQSHFQDCESVEISIYKLSLQKRLESLKDAAISDVNDKLILSFVDHCYKVRAP